MILSRRQFLALTIPALAVGQAPQNRRLKIVCVGGHPDDPESGCGGTLCRYAALGHAVTVIYLTRGEAGISGSLTTRPPRFAPPSAPPPAKL